MSKKVFKNIGKLLHGNKGFTLLELIVVVAIMGFLIAMVAPRFAGVVAGSVDPICDTNQQRLAGVLSSFNESTNSLPNMLTQLSDLESIPTAGGESLTTANAALGATAELIFWNGDKTRHADFAADFVTRNNFFTHALNEDEAAEIRGLGISQFIAADGDIEDVETGAIVLMIGAGAAGTADIGAPLLTAAYGEPDQMYRIVLGVGPRSQLVEEGLLTQAGTCPGSVQNQEFITHGNYNVVLPRLQATVDRIDSTILDTDGNYLITATGYEEGVDATTPGSATPVETIAGINLAAAQDSWNFATQCPEGHRWPGLEAENYAITH